MDQSWTNFVAELHGQSAQALPRTAELNRQAVELR